MLPNTLMPLVTEALKVASDSSPILSLAPVRGGYVSHAYRLTTAKGPYFLKWSDDPRAGRYSVEVRGLALIGQTGTVGVPAVLGSADAGAEHPGFLLLEWLTPASRDLFARRVGERLGAPLAALHRAGTIDGVPAPGYGLPRGDALGGWAHGEGWEAEWVRFYSERCLTPLIERAAAQGRLPDARRQGLDRLLARLDALLGPVPRRPALLHGDLWRNNVQCNQRGDLVLIDPHPFFGDREAELAYTEYAGGFPPVFYSAYEAAWPTEPDRSERRDLYRLWYLLRDYSHGATEKGPAIDAIVHWYAGGRR